MFVNTSLGYVGERYGLKEYEYIDENGKHIISKPDTTSSTIKYLISHNMLSDIDKEIMEFVYKFKYANAATIAKYISCSTLIPASMKKDNYEANLKRLRKNGILNMYSAGDNFNIYALSNGARLYLSLKKGRKYYNKSVPEYISANESLKYAVLAQFVAGIKAIASDRGFRVDVVMNKMHDIKDREFRLGTMVYLKNGRTTPLLPLCIRRSPEYIDYFVSKMADVSFLFNAARGELGNMVVVAMVEDYDHILDIHKVLLNKNVLDGCDINLVYVTDRIVYDGDFLDNVYVCESTSEGFKIQNKIIKV